MPRLLPVVEGDGEKSAVPALLYRLFAERRHSEQGWRVDDGALMRVGGLPAFRSNLDKYLRYLRVEAPDAVLVLLDLDEQAHCPKVEASALAKDIRDARLPFPVAVVFARREYEAWFLASIESIAPHVEALPDELRYEGEPEAPRDAKGWITAQMPAGRSYKPTTDQKRFTGLLDLDLARARSRSFRRLCHAVEELVQRAGQPVVTPAPADS